MRDIKYIIKRIIIGVGIALVLGYLRGGLVGNVYAQTIGSYSIGNNIGVVVDNTENGYTITVPGSPWAGYGDGYLFLNFSLYKVNGGSTNPNVALRTIRVYSGSASYNCFFGSSSVQNSTFNNISYSAVCPVFINSSGITSIWIGLQDNQQNSLSDYRLTADSIITFDQKDDASDYSAILGTINGNLGAIGSYIVNGDNSIISNNNTNSQNIINNQNSNTDKEIQSQKVCNTYVIDKNYTELDNKALNQNSGNITSNDSYIVTPYFTLGSDTTIKVLSTHTTTYSSCFYDSSKTLISCVSANSLSLGSYLTIPNNAKFFRTSINKVINKPTFELYTCLNGNQAIVDSNKAINDTLNNDDVSGASSEGNNFFGNFTVSSHGLSGIITAPLRLITSLSSTTCSSLVLPLPFVNQNANLPCMSTIYSLYPTFYNLWQVISTGVIAYMIIIKIFGHIKGLQDPNDDKIEVLNL